jgi:hypothetical protein
MEAWRQWPLGGRRKRAYQKQTKITLTPTGLLMEGDYTQNPGGEFTRVPPSLYTRVVPIPSDDVALPWMETQTPEPSARPGHRLSDFASRICPDGS